MFDNIVLVREINAILKYSPNKNDNSFYKTYKMPKNELDRQIRVSSHGTYLKFWVEQDYNPSFGINLSIVFTSNGIPTNDCIIDSETNEISKDCNPCIMNQDLTGNICKPRHVQGYNQKKRPFYVTQYVYNCENFDGSELNALIVAIKTASQTGIYNDPFADIESKKAIETKLYPKDRENENKTYITMKQKIRLTESQLHNVIRKCVNEALKKQNSVLKEWTEEGEWEDGDDLTWHIEDICSEFGKGSVIINGTLGLWDGKRTIQPTECKDIETAIYKCLGRDCDILDPNDIYIDENDIVHVKASHHDGVNYFTIEHA